MPLQPLRLKTRRATSSDKPTVAQEFRRFSNSRFPQELQDEIWLAAVPQPGLHVFGLEYNKVPAFNRFPSIRSTSGKWFLTSAQVNWRWVDWFSPRNFSAYCRDEPIRLVHRASREYVDGIRQAKPWVRLTVKSKTAKPYPPISINPETDVILLSFPTGTRLHLNPEETFEHLKHEIIGCEFPQLQDIQRIAFRFNPSDGNEKTNIPFIPSKSMVSMLYLPLHFAKLHTVYIVDGSTKLKPGKRPNMSSECFHAKNRRFYEVLVDDDAWLFSWPALEFADYATAYHFRHDEAADWCAGTDLGIARDVPAHPGSGMTLIDTFPNEEVPDFWKNAPKGGPSPVKFKVMAEVVDT